jgi:hypothetical protein
MMTGIERYWQLEEDKERAEKRKILSELRAGVTPILEEIEKLSWELEPVHHVEYRNSRN